LAKTENLTYSQKRKTQKPHWIIKPKNRDFYENRKPDAKKPNIRKPQQTPKLKKSFSTKTEKPI